MVSPRLDHGLYRIVSESAETSETLVEVSLLAHLDLHNLLEEVRDASSSVAGNH